MPTTNPYSVLVRDLMGRPGEHKETTLDVDAPEQLGEAIASVTPGTPIHLDLTLESLHDGILVSADVSTTASGECVRCLDPVSLPVEVEFQELFAYSRSEGFDHEVSDDRVDLEPVVRDSVVLALPFQPVCRPDCPGLDPVTGEKLAAGAESGSESKLDPRWAALAGFQTGSDDEGASPEEKK